MMFAEPRGKRLRGQAGKGEAQDPGPDRLGGKVPQVSRRRKSITKLIIGDAFRLGPIYRVVVESHMLMVRKV